MRVRAVTGFLLAVLLGAGTAGCGTSGHQAGGGPAPAAPSATSPAAPSATGAGAPSGPAAGLPDVSDRASHPAVLACERALKAHPGLIPPPKRCRSLSQEDFLAAIEASDGGADGGIPSMPGLP